MKKIILIILILTTCVFVTIAQVEGKLRVGLETGLLIPHQGGIGLPAAFELKYNIQKNMNIGLRTEATSFVKHKNYSANLFSISATYDYYFNSKNRLFSPFCGAGLGYYFCNVTDYSVANSNYNNPTCILRLGAEIGKFRTSLAYNLIRKQSEVNPFNKNSDYISLCIGFYIGGGKWEVQ